MNEEYNDRLLLGLSDCLNKRADCINKKDIEILCKSCNVTKEEAYRTLLASYCGFDTIVNPTDRYIFGKYFPQMVKKLDVAEYQSDLYYKNIKILNTGYKDWSFCKKTYKPYEAFVFDDMKKMSDGRIIPQIGYFEKPFEYPCVLEKGREWMTVTPNEINTMSQPIADATGKVLTFGLGLGYFAYSAHLKKNVSEVVVVEKDKNVIELFKKMILPQFPYKEKIKIVCSDAFDYAKTQMPEQNFNFVFVDIWHDVGDGLDLYFDFKPLEKLSPNATFEFWIEKTILCYVKD